MSETTSSSSLLDGPKLDMESIKPYSTKDEYLYAMKEDLSEWLNSMYSTNLNADNFIDLLENGVLICRHANNIMQVVYEANTKSSNDQHQYLICYRNDAKPQSFQARDNISNFIKWCRYYIKVRECLMFETDDLILKKNEKNFILCLLEISRYGSKYGFTVPTIIQLEQEIDNELIEHNIKQSSLDSVEHENLSLSIEDDDQESFKYSLENYVKSSTSISASISASLSSSLTSSDSSISFKQNSDSLLEQTSTNNRLSKIMLPFVRSHEKKELQIKKNQSNTIINKSLNSNIDFQKNEQAKNNFKSVSDKLVHSNINFNQTELEKHVNKIANRCTCAKKFPVIQIGEGKYRIGSTKTIVFIRILRNHIMVRVGGGWCTLDNYLNKHDPCRTKMCDHAHTVASCCKSVNRNCKDHLNVLGNDSSSKFIIHYEQFDNNSSVNPILLTPVKNSGSFVTNQQIYEKIKNKTRANSHPLIISAQPKINPDKIKTDSSANKFSIEQANYQVDFTNAKLVIERDHQGKQLDRNCKNRILISSLQEIDYQKKIKQSPNVKMYTKKNSEVGNSASKIDEFINKNQILQQMQKQQKTQPYNQHDQPTCSPYSSSLTRKNLHQHSTEVANKGDSNMKNKMKKLINIFPPNSSDNNNDFLSSQAMNNKTNQLDDSNTLVISSNNLDYMMFTPVYTETNLPPRLLRKYQKKASTELISNIDNSDKETILNEQKLKRNDVIDLAKTIQDIYNIDDDILELETGDKIELNENRLFPNFNSRKEHESETKKLKAAINVENKLIDTGKKDIQEIESENIVRIIESPNHFKSKLLTSTSPKAPPRRKIRYQKSRTCEIKTITRESLNNEQKFIGKDSHENGITSIYSSEDSLENIEKNCKNFIKAKTNTISNNNENLSDSKKYTFSLNYLNNDKSKFLKFIPLNNAHQVNFDELFDNSLPDSKNLDDSLELEKHQNTVFNASEEISLNQSLNRTHSRRAKWDKSPLELNYFNQHDSEVKKNENSNIINLPTRRNNEALNILANTYSFTTKKPVAAVVATPKQVFKKVDNEEKEKEKIEAIHMVENKFDLINKKTRNLDLAKQKLVEMKKSMDTQTIYTAKRNEPKTHPTKSTTTNSRPNPMKPRQIKKRSGERSMTTGIIHEQNKSFENNLKENSKTTTQKLNSKSNPKITKSSTNTSLSQIKEPYSSQRSTSVTSLIKLNDNPNDIVPVRPRRDSIQSNASSATNCTMSSGVNEYKENKSSELRKLANLKSKIIIKQLDPIYTRNNPVATEIIENQSEQSKKRLFAKKNEKSLLEITNSSFSNISKRDLMTCDDHKAKDTDATIKHTKAKSKSTTDLYYNFERTNSTLDLLELLNDTDAPKGDADRYRVMLNECEKFEKSIKLSTNKLYPSKQVNQKAKASKDKTIKKHSKPRSHSAEPLSNRNSTAEAALRNVQ